jgi:hypothetical protein
MGLDVYLRYGKDDSIQHNSEKYPNHYFKIGYFRSSYNSWGLNSVLTRTIGKDLYYIFERPGEKSDFKPKWSDCRMRCIDVIEEFSEFVKKIGNVSVMCVSPRIFIKEGDSIPENEKDATDIFLKVKEGKENSLAFRSFSSGDGRFHLDGLKCYGFIPGKDYSGRDCTYVVFEPELEDDEGLPGDVYKDYIKALEIVLETIDYILDKPVKEAKKYQLHWSA